MSVLTGFHNVLDEFLTDLVETHPTSTISDIQVIRDGVQLGRKANPRLILDQFMELTFPYYEEIYNRKEEFFLDFGNLKKHPKFQADVDKQENYMEKMTSLKEVWGDMSDHNKDTIWKYFQSLLKWGALASKNTEHRQVLVYLKKNPNLF